MTLHSFSACVEVPATSPALQREALNGDSAGVFFRELQEYDPPRFPQRHHCRRPRHAALGAPRAGEPSRSRARLPIRASSSGWPAAWRPRTFDPKRYTPFEVGVPEGRILCTFPSIPTPSIHPHLAGARTRRRRHDRATLIRSHHVADLGNILHSRHQYHWHTGYVPPQTVACPHLGSWIARVRGRTIRRFPPSSTSANGSKASANPKS